MDRFNSITFDERSWTVEHDNCKNGYYFCNHAHSLSYFRSCFLKDFGIVGIEHVSHSTFLIYSKFNDFYEITRIHILKDTYEIQYTNLSYRNILSLSKNTILIMNLECPVVYNVKTNSKVDLPFFQVTSFSVLEKDGKNYLYCNKSMLSNNKKFKSIDFLHFVLDAETLQPVLPVFSTLRGNFIDLDSFADIPKFIETEQYYKQIVDDQLSLINSRLSNSGKNILLSSFNQKSKQ